MHRQFAIQTFYPCVRVLIPATCTEIRSWDSRSAQGQGWTYTIKTCEIHYLRIPRQKLPRRISVSLTQHKKINLHDLLDLIISAIVLTYQTKPIMAWRRWWISRGLMVPHIIAPEGKETQIRSCQCGGTSRTVVSMASRRNLVTYRVMDAHSGLSSSVSHGHEYCARMPPLAFAKSWSSHIPRIAPGIVRLTQVPAEVLREAKPRGPQPLGPQATVANSGRVDLSLFQL